MDVQRDANGTDARRDPSSTDDLAGLEALFYWTHLSSCVIVFRMKLTLGYLIICVE